MIRLDGRMTPPNGLNVDDLLKPQNVVCPVCRHIEQIVLPGNILQVTRQPHN